MVKLVQEYVILLPLVTQLLGIIFFALGDKLLLKKQKRLMLEIAFFAGLLIIQNVADYILNVKVTMPYVRTIVSIAGYSIRPLIILLFCQFVSLRKKHIAAWILVAANAAIHLTALFSPIVFSIRPDNSFIRGALGYTSFIISAMLLTYLVLCTILEYRQRGKIFAMASFIVGLVILAALMDLSPLYFDYPASYMTMTIVSCSLFYYVWLHIEHEERHKNALIAEQHIMLMMSQIQPHFLYNTLSTIQALCLTNPEEASEITGKFGKYLRQNLESVDQPNLIPFERELQHTKIYAEIEMVRFPNITVEYEIKYDDFYLPSLSIQPLVENAIRHGVRNREHGIIKIHALQIKHGVIIIVKDNGVGFDAAAMNKEGSHIGLRNVKERIEKMCGGTFAVSSIVDEGTTITIMLPKETGEKK